MNNNPKRIFVIRTQILKSIKTNEQDQYEGNYKMLLKDINKVLK